MKSRSAIALLITMLFIMVITASIGLSLRYLNETSAQTSKENFMYQVFISVDDILKLLKGSKELELLSESNSSAVFYQFLSENSFIPLESSGMEVTVKIKSARARFNPNTLKKENTQALRQYMSIKMVNDAYVDILLDSVNGIKQDLSYNTNLFIQKPYLFRDYIASKEHLDELNQFYLDNYHDNSLKNIDFDELFYFSKNKESKIDLNFATPAVWELILGTSEARAQQLSLNAGAYTDISSLNLSSEEELSLKNFKVSYFEPFLEIVINLKLNGNKAIVKFEYDITNKKGSNFSYAI